MKRTSPAVVISLAVVTALASGGALWWATRSHPLPPPDLRGVSLLALAVVCEGAGKWEAGRVFRRSTPVSVEMGDAFRGALAGAAVARLVPLGGALTPPSMAWAARIPLSSGVPAAVHTTALNYAWLLVVGGAGAVWAGTAGDGGTAVVTAGAVASVAGLTLLVSSRRLGALGRRLPGRLGQAAGRLLPDLPSDRTTILSAAARILWEAAALGLVLAALRVGAGPLDVLAAFGVSQIASGVPGLPGGAGAAEAGLVGTLALLGFPAATTIAPALVFRIVSYWLVALAGLLAGAGSFLLSPAATAET